MKKKKDFYQLVEGIYRKDRRYKPDSYEFVIQGLHFTQDKLKREGHLTGGELASGLRDFAIEQYGPMAKTVLTHWGITCTEDFGHIVYNMISKKMLGKTETDSLEDFKAVYDFEAAFSNILHKLVRLGFEKDKAGS